MKFVDYKKLARQVFPELPVEFEAMSDNLKIYQLVFVYTCPADVHKFDGLTDLERIHLFSVSNCTTMQIRHIFQFGETFWE